MATKATDFAGTIAAAYTTSGPAIDLGRGVHDGSVERSAVVQIPLSMMNRHGLVAGATGTGKTRTLQGLAEQLSAAGVSVFVADMKGDLSGLGTPGAADGPAPKRDAELGIAYTPTGFPVEYLALGGIGAGVPVRATVSDFGPQLLGKVLDSNETQEQSLGLVFRYADTKQSAAPRPLRPARAPHVPLLRPGQGRARGARRRLVGDRRRAPPLARRARGRRRHRALR